MSLKYSNGATLKPLFKNIIESDILFSLITESNIPLDSTAAVYQHKTRCQDTNKKQGHYVLIGREHWETQFNQKKVRAHKKAFKARMNTTTPSDSELWEDTSKIKIRSKSQRLLQT